MPFSPLSKGESFDLEKLKSQSCLSVSGEEVGSGDARVRGCQSPVDETVQVDLVQRLRFSKETNHSAPPHLLQLDRIHARLVPMIAINTVA